MNEQKYVEHYFIFKKQTISHNTKQTFYYKKRNCLIVNKSSGKNTSW